MTAVPPIRHRSPFPDVAVPEHLSIPEFVLNSPALTSHPNRPILADLQGCTLTPVQLRHAVRAVRQSPTKKFPKLKTEMKLLMSWSCTNHQTGGGGLARRRREERRCGVPLFAQRHRVPCCLLRYHLAW